MDSDELQKIIKAAELVNSNIDLREVLKNIVNVAVDLTNADRGTLYLVDNNRKEIWSMIAMGAETIEIRLKIGEGLAGYVAKSGETINIKNVGRDSRFQSNYDQVTSYKTKNMICFPIKNNKSEIVGVLQLLNNRTGEFTDRDEKFLIALSIHAAIAINNALMLQKQISVNEELKIAKQEAEKFAMLRTHFLAQMSHEIRTPLNIILGGMELLKLNLNSHQSEELSELFQMLESGSSRIIRTIDEIIEMSKIRAGDYELQVEPIKLEEEILQPVIENFKESAAKKEIKLQLEKTTDQNNITCDRFMVNQIFTEIIDNAIKFTKQGTVLIKQFINEEGNLTVSIKDTGIGISQEYLKQIFEPFTQEQTGYTRTYEGNGLALALAKKYAELNNLSIEVQSEKNVGSEFKIIFN
ncbi:MAG: GAF domain-containing sensor histidine kinase [Ignavibacteriales bacterium]|nr:GAF domain-containing sensor histidine kinase [Ignavibacteriales bacterium]